MPRPRSASRRQPLAEVRGGQFEAVSGPGTSPPYGRDCEVARTSEQAVRLLTRLRGRHIDQLWLDHDLGGDDTIWPAVRLLEDAHLAGHPFDIGIVHVHAARAAAAHQMVISLRRAAYAVERSYDLRMWTW